MLTYNTNIFSTNSCLFFFFSITNINLRLKSGQGILEFDLILCLNLANQIVEE